MFYLNQAESINIEVVRLLVKAGVDVNHKNKATGRYVVHYAAAINSTARALEII